MSLTDPTYLRYIVDGLHNQSIQQENLAALPQGLIGIYEEALPWEQNIQDRGRFLQFFSVWALLKKEVSAILVSSLLNWPEQEVIDAHISYTTNASVLICFLNLHPISSNKPTRKSSSLVNMLWS